MIRILILWEYEFADKDYARLRINEFGLLGADVQVLLISSWLNPHANIKHSLPASRTNVSESASLIDSLKIIRQFRPDAAFTHLQKTRSKYFQRLIFQLSLAYVCKIFDFRMGDVPFQHGGPQNDLLGPKRFLKKICKTVFYYPFKSDFSVVSGKNGVKHASGEVIFAHSFDYDLYLGRSSKSRLQLDNATLVFLDENYVDHPDYKYEKCPSVFCEKKYYQEVNELLDRISLKYKLAVKIQLHPTSNKLVDAKRFKFPISNRNLIDTIAASSLVVAHSSTAIGLAAVFKKPLLFIETEELFQNSAYHSQIMQTADFFGLSPIRLNNFKLPDSIPKPDLGRYDFYIQQFVKPDANDGKTSEQIIFEALKSIIANQRCRNGGS